MANFDKKNRELLFLVPVCERCIIELELAEVEGLDPIGGELVVDLFDKRPGKGCARHSGQAQTIQS